MRAFLSKALAYLAPAKNIWCMRRQDVYFLISKVEDGGSHWYLVLFGFELWTGPNKPQFLNRHKPQGKRA